MEPYLFLNRYQIDLSEDGTAKLIRNESDRWLADMVQGLLQRGVLKALAITLCFELLVVAGLVQLLGPREWLKRMAIVCIGVNLLTLVPLWITSAIGTMMLGLWPGMKLMVFLELMVVAVEGSVYATLGRVGWLRGLTIAFFANATSFLLGLAIG